MLDPKVLVAISCYNHGKFLESSVESIISQSYKNLDICIINDCSSKDQRVDEIIESLKQRDSRVRGITFNTNMGKWHCLNEAIRTSKAVLCTSHDADDISLPERIERQVKCLIATNSLHNLCGFYHCWSEEDIENFSISHKSNNELSVIPADAVKELVIKGSKTPGINHYDTGNFETAGVTALFYRQIWEMGIRFNPPNAGLRVLVSEDSDFNFRLTAMFGQTTILAEQQYCYRRNTSTNQELI